MMGKKSNPPMQTQKSAIRSGATLLELLLATSILATVVAAVSVVVRTSHAAWQAHEGDLERIEAAHAVLRHIVRDVRQADAVTMIYDAGGVSGLGIRMEDGLEHFWFCDGSNVTFTIQESGSPTSSGTMATNISSLDFTGYESDGVTVTSTYEDMRAVRCELTFSLPQETGGARTISSYVWIRSW